MNSNKVSTTEPLFETIAENTLLCTPEHVATPEHLFETNEENTLLGSPEHVDSEDEESINHNTFTLQPPPEDLHATYAAALDAIHKFSKANGYEVSIDKGLKKKNGTYYKKLLRCTQGGKMENTRKLTTEARVRLNRGSKKNGCPMSFILVADDPGNATGQWKVVHQSGNRSFLHNHHGFDAIAFPGHRRRAREGRITKEIKEDADASIKVGRTLARFQNKDPNILITSKDIENERSRLRREKLETLTPIEALFETLDELGFRYRNVVDGDGTLEKIIIVAPQSIELLKNHPDILLADCTFKTNRYNMPLLNLAGVTSINTTIQAVVVFVPNEKEVSYTWALEQYTDILH